MSVNALCSAGWAALTTLLFLQFATIRFKRFRNISETIGPIDLSVNALCSACSAAPTTLLSLQFARISVSNILSYLRNYCANRRECQRAVLSRSGCADYTVVSSICKNRVSKFCHISETIGPIDLSVNALCSACSAAPTTLLFLQFARISVLNILSYLRNYWANRPECQRVVLSR